MSEMGFGIRPAAGTKDLVSFPLADQTVDIVLVSAPFASITHPNLGLSILKAVLQEAGLHAHVLYLNLKYASWHSHEFHEWIAEGSSEIALIGEWIFSPLSLNAISLQEYKSHVLVPNLGLEVAERVLPVLVRARSERDEFILHCFRDIIRMRPQIIGFSTSFQQTNASLLLAALIKVHCPDTLIVFGGANCEGDMGKTLLSSYRCIDYVFSGSAEDTFPQFAREVIRRGNINFRTRYFVGRGLKCLDDLPYPNFDNYFAQLRTLKLEGRVIPGLLIEASRGCNWGMRSHCRFCGMNGLTMEYRHKSPERLLNEIHFLTERYNVHRIEFVDNNLFPGYATSVFGELSKESISYEVFSEVIPHINLDSLRLLRQGGLCWVQAGVETLHEELIHRMGKSGSVIKRIEFLKHCRELDIRVDWNFLYGIPGETGREYKDMLSLLPLIVHLPPPHSSVIVRPERFSPYFDYPSVREHIPIRPIPAYQYVFDSEPNMLAQHGYYFVFIWEYSQHPDIVAKEVLMFLKQWQQAHYRSDKPTLVYCKKDGFSIVVDSRSLNKREMVLHDDLTYILDRCHKVTSSELLSQHYYRECQKGWMVFQNAIEKLVSEGLLFVDNDRLLSLVLASNSLASSQKVFPGGQLAVID